MSRDITVGLILLLGGSVVAGFFSFNGWQWQIDAVAADMRGIEYQIVIGRKRDISREIYELESLAEDDPDEFTDRDEQRLRDLKDELEQTDADLDELVQSDG